MTLPNSFSTPKQYFEAVTSFLHDYQYLFNFANTDVLVCDVLDRISVDNIKNIEMIDNLDSLEGNEYIKELIEKLKQFEVDIEQSIGDDNPDNKYKFEAPLSHKKQHEISYLAREIKEICQDINCETVVDFGSGLGYLDQHLFGITNYQILGLECNENFYVEAKKRQRKYHMESIEKVKYIKHMIRGDSNESIERYLADKFKIHDSFCITGLHACADLTRDAIDLFLKMVDCKSMIIMSCCYHKMMLSNNVFKNFPVSDSCKEVVSRNNSQDFLKIPFLRLGAQPPKSKNDLNSLVFNLLARGVLQLYAYKHGCKLKRKKRKAVRMKSMQNNFDSYIKDASINGFTMTKQNNENSESTTLEFDLNELRDIWRELGKETFLKAAIFILLQNRFQSVIENFILYERLVYLKENGIENCRYKRIFNNCISPRCLALIAYK